MRADMLHQQIDPIDEDSEMMMVVPEDAVQTLAIKPTTRGLVASTIVEVEEEEHEEMPESLEAVSKFVIQQATTVTAGGPGKGQAVQTQVMGTMPTAPQAVATQHVVAMSLDRSKIQPKYRSKRARKLGVSTGHGEDTHPDLLVHGESPLKGKFARERRLRKIQKLREQMQKSPEKKSSVYSAVRKYHDDKNYMALTKCLDCGAILEECDDNTISLAIVVLSTFIHRDPELAAPMLLEMLQVVGRIASATFYTWQTDSSGHPPGHCCTVASQFLRCVLHKLAPNGIFPQLFLSKIEDYTFLKTMAIALTDFNELTPTDAITHLLECDMNDTFRIIEILFRSPANKNLVTLLEPVGKLVSFAIQKARFKLKHLLEICSLCNRIFMKLVQFVMVDAGGKMNDFSIVDGEWDIEFGQHCTGAMDCMRQYLQDAIEYIGDLHTLTKVKNNLKGGSQNLNEDTLGSQLKAGVAQIIALEFTRCNQAEGTKAIQRPKEFIDCISHVRLLSWLLLGSLTHTAISLQSGESGILSQPVPLDAGTHIADHVQVILGGFAEQSKASVLHMSSLFHAFILCQLWTMYCEQIASINAAGSEHHSSAMLSIMDFWGRVTPGVLQLLSHTKVLADMVNLHFLSLMEALQECNSSVLAKLFPLWTQILFSYPTKLQGNLQVRLQNCENWPPPNPAKGDVMSYHSTMLLKWLKRLQFKMGQIEIQSSAATQFYTV
ncbi:hypothetical protein BSL78_28574 [Apostichopus japonicus]|uniref:Uncharacterized protein n=1 Tax=Stichopus japonicus TaxID=307972 RepID=A0A2G8JFU6_STIJA|nr:hypothetical protein BSL78_28574 [Apostichopus japonicus]